MHARSFEELRVWQLARELNRLVVAAIRSHEFADGALANQMKRASVSCMANIAEGYARRTRADVINFFGIAIASAAELQSHAFAAYDAGYCSRELFTGVHDTAISVQKLAKAFIRAGRGQERASGSPAS